MSIKKKIGLSVAICVLLIISCIASSGCVSEDNLDTKQIDETAQMAKDFLCNGIWVETPRSGLHVRYAVFTDNKVTWVKHMYGANNGGYPAMCGRFNWKPNDTNSIIIYDDSGEYCVDFDGDNRLIISIDGGAHSFTKTPYQLSIDGIWIGDYITNKYEVEGNILLIGHNKELHTFIFVDSRTGLLVKSRPIGQKDENNFDEDGYYPQRKFSVSGNSLSDIWYDDFGNVVKELRLTRVS